MTASASGALIRMDALPFGIAAWRLGAGRARAEDRIVHAAGIDLHAKPGDTVTAGQPLFTLLADDAARFDRALDALADAWEIGAAAASDRSPLVRERITAENRTQEGTHGHRPARRPEDRGRFDPFAAKNLPARSPRWRGTSADDH